LIRGRIPVPLSRTWRLFDPSRPTDVRRFSLGLACARCRGSRAGSLPTDMAPRVRRSARGTVAAAHGVTAAAAAGVGAAEVRGMTAIARARVVRELTDGFVRATRAADCACPSPEEAVDTRLQGSGWKRRARLKGSSIVRLSCPLAVLGTPAWWGPRRVKKRLDTSVGGAGR